MLSYYGFTMKFYYGIHVDIIAHFQRVVGSLFESCKTRVDNAHSYVETVHVHVQCYVGSQ